MMKKISIISDMDGVLYRGHELISGANEFIKKLKKNRHRFLFLTNNSEKTQKELKEKLESLGIEGLEEKNFITAGMATADFLKSQKPNSKVYVIGSKALKGELTKKGLKISEDQPDYVVVGMTKKFDFEILTKGVTFIRNGAKFIGTNPDILDPVEGGFVPAAGSLLAFIEKATGKKPFVVGKPNAIMMTIAKKMLKSHSGETIMIGDRMDTDIIGGLEAGMKTCLVLSGITNREDLDMFPYRPNIILNNVGELDLDKVLD
ncbi:MAG: HAD-IIA family hydrolase [Fusobacteriota bacterium]